MYLKSVHLENIRGFRELVWEAPADQLAGWHVIIGDNGSGKSTFLRAVALALIGPEEALAIRQDWSDWIYRDCTEGVVELDLFRDVSFDQEIVENGNINTSKTRVGLVDKTNSVPFHKAKRYLMKISSPVRPITPLRNGKRSWYIPIWKSTNSWFSAAYGPFRRFTGGDKEDEEIFKTNSKLAAHLSVFKESVALTEALSWLKDLRFKQLEERPEGDFLDVVKTFVNQADFLPNGVQMGQVSSDGVEFVDGNGCAVQIEDLSDGYRSILSLTLELIRQMARVYGLDKVFDKDDPTKVTVPGVVLIDEVDAHLHPTWQRNIGVWFRTHFPKMQFLVTTHSPLVCQAATVGSVYRLPQPGSDEKGERVTGVELDRLLYGNVLDAYSTELFGAIQRSEEGSKRLERLAELNIKSLHHQLSEEESKEQAELRASVPTAAYTIEVANR